MNMAKNRLETGEIINDILTNGHKLYCVTEVNTVKLFGSTSRLFSYYGEGNTAIIFGRNGKISRMRFDAPRCIAVRLTGYNQVLVILTLYFNPNFYNITESLIEVSKFVRANNAINILVGGDINGEYCYWSWKVNGTSNSYYRGKQFYDMLCACNSVRFFEPLVANFAYISRVHEDYRSWIDIVVGNTSTRKCLIYCEVLDNPPSDHRSIRIKLNASSTTVIRSDARRIDYMISTELVNQLPIGEDVEQTVIGLDGYMEDVSRRSRSVKRVSSYIGDDQLRELKRKRREVMESVRANTSPCSTLALNEINSKIKARHYSMITEQHED